MEKVKPKAMISPKEKKLKTEVELILKLSKDGKIIIESQPLMDTNDIISFLLGALNAIWFGNVVESSDEEN